MKITPARIVRAVRHPRRTLKKAGEKIRKTAFRSVRPLGYAPPPESVTFFLTSHCNLRCRMCAQYGESGKSDEIPKSVLPASLCKSIAEELAPYGANFTLMGGEPLLHPECLDIARHITSLGACCTIITNGVTLRKWAEGVLEAGVDNLNISIDGFRETHDTIRGVPGTWDRVNEGLDKILALRKKNGSPKPLITILYTITKHNFGGLVEFAEWAAEKGVDGVHFYHLRFYSAEDYAENAQYMEEHLGQNAGCQEGFVFDPGRIDVKTLRKQVLELRSRPWPIEVQVLPDHPIEAYDDYYSERYRRPANSACNVPWTCASVAPTGGLMPCMDFGCGDLNEKPFLELWNGERFRKFRRVMRKTKRFPVCHRCCV